MSDTNNYRPECAEKQREQKKTVATRFIDGGRGSAAEIKWEETGMDLAEPTPIEARVEKLEAGMAGLSELMQMAVEKLKEAEQIALATKAERERNQELMKQTVAIAERQTVAMENIAAALSRAYPKKEAPCPA